MKRTHDDDQTIIDTTAGPVTTKKRATQLRWTLDIPTTIHDLSALQSQYEGNPLIELKFTGALYRRNRLSEESKWFEWSRCCKHGGRLANCCGRQLSREEVLQQRKKTLEQVPASTVAGVKTGAFLRKRNHIAKSNTYIYPKAVIEEQKQTTKQKKRVERLQYIDNLIANGCKDQRRYNSKCPRCNLIRIPYELHEHTLTEGETFSYCNVNKKDKIILWQQMCVPCTQLSRVSSYTDGTSRFITTKVTALNFHIDNTTTYRREVLDMIINRDRGICATCGITTIFRGKSGWKQFSINDKHPDKRHINVTSASGAVDRVRTNTPPCDLVTSCLACNSFQNSLPWSKALHALDIIAHSPYAVNPNFKDQLTKDEKRWARVSRNIQCPEKLKLQLMEAYGRRCHYTGTPLVFAPNDPFTASFDRIDSSKPYTFEQTRLTTKHINYVKKSSITEDELLDWLRHLRENKDFIHSNYMKSLSEVATILPPQ